MEAGNPVMIQELLILIGLLIAAGLLLIGNRRREQRRLNARTRETLSSSLRQEIDAERAEAIDNRQKFEEAMKKAGAS